MGVTEEKQIVNTNCDIAWEYLKAGEYDLSIKYSQEALTTAERINFQSGVAQALTYIGSHYEEKGDYTVAIKHFFHALKIYDSLIATGSKERSLKFLKKSSATVLHNIGKAYMFQNDYKKALGYFHKALVFSKENGDKTAIAAHTGIIGVAYIYNFDYDSSLVYLLQAQKMDAELKNTSQSIYWLGNIGNVYYLKGQQEKDPNKKSEMNEKALLNYQEALKESRITGDKTLIASWLGNIGSINTESGKFEDAELYLNEGMALAEDMKALNMIKQFEESLSNLYEAWGKTDKALLHYKKFIAVRDSLYNDENTRNQTRIEMNYEFDKKQAIAKAEQEKKDEVTRIVIWSISSGLFLVLILAIFIFRSYKQKQKANVIITQQKEEVERQKQLVEDKQKEILDSIHYAKRIQQSLMPTMKYIEKQIGRLMK